jgi:D-alanyl-lipoteichoic acid acyltransferase DltB (MBOAT superfamily)
MFPFLDPLQPTALPALLFLVWLPVFALLKPTRARVFFVSAGGVTLVFVAGPPLAVGLTLIILAGYFLVEGAARWHGGRRAGPVVALVLIHAGYWACFWVPIPGGYSQLPTPHAPGVYILFSGIGLTLLRLLSYCHERLRRHAPQLSLGDYLAYMFFMPQFRHGPIERGPQFVPRLTAARERWVPDDLALGLLRAGWGVVLLLGLRHVLRHAVPETYKGSPFRLLSELVAEPERLSWAGLLALLHLPAVALYIIETSAADIQLGVARAFGVRGSENFRYPFLAANPREFWQRWNITLSSWLRDYAYVPLCRWNRRRYLSVLLVFVYVGLLHGLQWRCLVWGVYTGFTLAAFAWIQDRRRRVQGGAPPPARNRVVRIVRAVLARVVTMHWACLGVTIFLDPRYCGYRVLRHYLHLITGGLVP